MLILNKNKSPDRCESYRPISLIIVDAKLLSKLLVRRLEGILPLLINPDQTGFIQNHFSSTNIRRLLNIIQYSNQTNYKTYVISLDAEKAFDRIEWTYLFNILERFGLGEGFIEWIKTICKLPEACVITNGVQSSAFPLQRLYMSSAHSLVTELILGNQRFLPLGDQINSLPDISNPFQWSPSGFTYLGLNIPPVLKDLWY